jgi:predicted ester cyclase
MEIKGPEGFRQFATMIWTAFPDIHITIDDCIGEGNMVASCFTLKGTFKGELMGMSPTGKQITFPEAVFVRFECSQEVEATTYANMLSFYQQLGISPPAA